MNWIFLALLAPFIYAINVFLDKYLISAKLPDYRSLPIFGAFLAIPVVIILGFFQGFGSVSIKDALLVIITGVFAIWGFSLYLESLIKEETSIIIIFIQLIPAMVLVLSYFILGERINFQQFLGFSLLLTSSILVSLKKEKMKINISKQLIYIFLADVLWSLSYILIKFASVSVNFPSLVMYESVGVILGVLSLLIFIMPIKRAFQKTIIKIRKPILVLVLLNEALFLIGKIITYLAVTIGPAALISVLGSTQIFYGIILGIGLTLLLPKVFKENLSKYDLIKKALLGLMAFAGIYLIT